MPRFEVYDPMYEDEPNMFGPPPTWRELRCLAASPKYAATIDARNMSEAAQQFAFDQHFHECQFVRPLPLCVRRAGGSRWHRIELVQRVVFEVAQKAVTRQTAK